MKEFKEDRIAEKIKTIRKYLGLSQIEFAVKVGELSLGGYAGRPIEVMQVSKWERGIGTPSLRNMEAVSKLSKVSMNDLLNDELTVATIENMMFKEGIEKVNDIRTRSSRRRLCDPIRVSAKQIKQLRIELNMTQIDFGNLIGERTIAESTPSNSMISMWENGRGVPSVEHEDVILGIMSDVSLVKRIA